jgi:hypothetical protein
MEKTEVIKYIESIKHPKRFLEYCKKYHEEEPRDIAYVLSSSIVSRDPTNTSFILAGAKLIIITWNAAGFQRLSRENKADLENDILKAYKKTETKLKELKGERLELLNLNDAQLKGGIKSIFLEFSSKKSIGLTGASKILHILNPHVFMMWDANIRNAYHKLHSKSHKVGDGECYLEFLRQSQEIIKAILSKKSEDDLWREHLTFVDKEFMKAFSFKETTLKMLDEYNYVRFTRKINLMEVQK